MKIISVLELGDKIEFTDNWRSIKKGETGIIEFCHHTEGYYNIKPDKVVSKIDSYDYIAVQWYLLRYIGNSIKYSEDIIALKKQAIRDYLKVRGSKHPKISTITDIELLIDMAVNPQNYDTKI